MLSVKEAFGEIEIPIVRDRPLLNELTLSGAVRVSDYNTSAGTVWTYNGAVYYAPIHDLRFRANYSRSVRAPTQSDLFSAQSQNFNFISDPCDVLFINAGPNRAANCAAAGVPAGFVNDPARNFSLAVLEGGNPALKVETSTSYTVGAIIEPHWIPGLSITVDYYNIKVRNLIATLSAQTIINSCYNSPSGINNPFCAEVFRNPDHTFANPATLAGPINFQKQITRGIDVDLGLDPQVRHWRSPGSARHLQLRFREDELYQPDRSDLRRSPAERARRSPARILAHRRLPDRAAQPAVQFPLYRQADDRHLRGSSTARGPSADERRRLPANLVSGDHVPQCPASAGT